MLINTLTLRIREMQFDLERNVLVDTFKIHQKLNLIQFDPQEEVTQQMYWKNSNLI